MIWRQAWRNLWRNPRRTFITMTAVGLNAAILIAVYSLMDGLLKQTVANVTDLVIGEVQIHVPKYLVNRSIYSALSKPGAILAEMDSAGVAAAPRSYGYGLVARESKSAGALFWGVDPARERKAFDLSRHMLRGRFLGDEPRGKIVLGRKLARTLNAEVGSELVVVVQAADGSLGNELFLVEGILKTAGEVIDRNAALLHQADFRDLFVSGGRIHEIALNSRGNPGLDEVAGIAARSAPGAEVRTWRQLVPSLSDMLNLFDASIGLFGLVFFLAGGLGVMNTMLMATFERVREFGILKGPGGRPLAHPGGCERRNVSDGPGGHPGRRRHRSWPGPGICRQWAWIPVYWPATFPWAVWLSIRSGGPRSV